MRAEQAVRAMLKALREVGAPHMVVGGYAANRYGITRLTKDIDFLIDMTDEDLRRLLGLLPHDVRLDPQANFETVTGKLRRIFHVADSPFIAEFFEADPSDDFDKMRLKRRIEARLVDEPTWVATAEDTLIVKLRWALLRRRAKDIDDARNIIAVSGDHLDWPYIHEWTDRHGTRQLLEELRSSLPPLD